MKQQVIYKIRNVVNGKFYVGSSTDTQIRFKNHRRLLRKNRHHCKHLQAAWNKYGEDCFKFEIIEVIPDGESLQAAEDRWLAEHVSKEHCYNTGMRSDAPWRGVFKERHPSFGRPVSPEQREQISATLKAFYAADITNHPRFGKVHTDESKARISAARMGKMAGEAHYRYGKTLSEEVRRKIGDTQRGKPKAPRVMSEAGRAKILQDYADGKRVSVFKGRKHTLEARAKMSKRVFVMPDGILFSSLTQVLQYYGLKMPTLRRALVSGLPLQKGPLKGYMFQYSNGMQTEQDLRMIGLRIPLEGAILAPLGSFQLRQPT